MFHIKSQSPNLCYLCKKVISHKTLLCNECIENPYLVEDARKVASNAKDIKIFRQLYKKNFSEIKNNNTERFWDNEFMTELNFNDQDSMTKDKLRRIVKKIPTNTRILDLGFGQGYFEEVLLKTTNNIKITGIDISKQAVIRANKKFSGNYVLGNILNIRDTVKNTNFDIATALEVIEHIPPSKIFTFLSDINHLLKPNGIFILSTPLNEHLRIAKKNPSSHVRDYSISIITTELELSGFKILHYETLYAFRKWYVLKKIVARVFPNHWEPNNVIILATKT